MFFPNYQSVTKYVWFKSSLDAISDEIKDIELESDVSVLHLDILTNEKRIICRKLLEYSNIVKNDDKEQLFKKLYESNNCTFQN